MAVIVAPHLMDNPEAIVEVIVDDDGHPAVVESVPIVGEVEEEFQSPQEDGCHDRGSRCCRFSCA